MTIYTNGDVVLNYDVEGDGFPVLAIAPGGMRSINTAWDPLAWSPQKILSDQYRVIGMDQRNAGLSRAPISSTDSWATYTSDQLSLLDHLEIESCHLFGMCIGGPYIASLLKTAPERFRSAVMLQPVGIEDNRSALEDMFDQWSEAISDEHPEADEADWASFRTNMWGGEFLLAATPDEIASMQTPLLVMMGDDLYHPRSTSLEIAELAPRATLVQRWKDDAVIDETIATIRSFLAEHSPS